MGMISTKNGHRNLSNNKDFGKTMNFHLFDLTATFYAFDFNTYDCSHDGLNGGHRVVPLVKTFQFMYETL